MKRILIPLLVASLFYGWAVYKWHGQYNQVKPKTEQALEQTANLSQSIINADAYKAMLSEKTIARTTYDRLVEPLVKLHQSYPDIAHIYTVSKLGPDYYSILDTGPSLYKVDPNREFKYETGSMEKIETPDPGLEKAFEGVAQTYTLEPNRNEFGADIARYAPLFDKGGKQVGVVALTMNKGVTSKLQRKITENLVIELALYTLLFAVVLSIISIRNAKIHKLELKSEATEEQFRTMVEKMPGAVYIFTSRPKGEKGTLLMLSKSAEELLNISPEEAERNWKELVDILPANLKESERGKIRQAKSTMSAWECEFKSPRTNVWLSNKATPRKDESGNVNWFGSITDITHQKRESEQLEETNLILKQIGEAPDDPLTLNKICEFSLGKGDKAAILYTTINGKLYPVAGAGIEEALGEIISDPKEVGTSSGGPAACMVQSQRLDIVSILESQLYSKAEGLRNSLLGSGFKSSTCYPLISTEDQCLGVLEILRKSFVTESKTDIKEEQAAHLCLAGLERERNRRSLESNERRYRTLFETSPVGICEINSKGDIFYTNQAFDNIVDEKIYNDIKRHGMEEGRKEIKGEEVSLLAETTKIEKASGKHHFITFVSDISEQKENEQKAISSKELAEASNKAKSEFLAVMSHEIRTPLNGVIGFSQILEGMDLKPKEKSFVSKIRQSGETLLSTINDILSLSKIEAGKIDFEYRAFDLARTIETSAELLSPKAQEKRIYLKVETNSLPPAIIGDETRIRQILLNLTGNAIKFTETGGVKIEASYKNGTVEIRVKDTGIGVSEENQKKLFQPFSQADSSTTRKYGGTGLGLVICRKLGELMGGSITLKSIEGEGSTFTLKFPAEASEAPQEKPTVFKEEEDLLPLSILVAEDDEVNRLVISEMLKGLGHEIEFAKNGKEALQKAKELRTWTDLILMDMRMPEMDGLEATTAIRLWEKKENLPQLPIFALTANAMEEDKNRCIQAGMTNYVSKPIDISILKKALSQCQKAKRAAIASYNTKTVPPVTQTSTASTKRGEALETKEEPKKAEKTPRSIEADGLHIWQKEIDSINTSPTKTTTSLEDQKSKNILVEEDPEENIGGMGGFEDFEGFNELIESKESKESEKSESSPLEIRKPVELDKELVKVDEDKNTSIPDLEGDSIVIDGTTAEVKKELDSLEITPEQTTDQSDDTIFGEWGFGERSSPIFEEDTVNEDKHEDDPFYNSKGRGSNQISKDIDPYDEDIVSVETLNACLEILPIERVASVILPSIEENCRKGAAIILSENSSPKEKANAAHKMCGSLGTFGCIALERVARGIESNYERTAAPSHEEGGLTALVEKTLDRLRKTIDKKLRN